MYKHVKIKGGLKTQIYFLKYIFSKAITDLGLQQQAMG